MTNFKNMEMPTTSFRIQFENGDINITAWLSSAWDCNYSITAKDADAYDFCFRNVCGVFGPSQIQSLHENKY